MKNNVIPMIILVTHHEGFLFNRPRTDFEDLETLYYSDQDILRFEREDVYYRREMEGTSNSSSILSVTDNGSIQSRGRSRTL